MYWSQIGPQHAPQSVVGAVASASGGIFRPLLLLWWWLLLLLLLLHDDGIGGSDDNIVVGKCVAVNVDIFGDVIEAMSPDITGFISMSTGTSEKKKNKNEIKSPKWFFNLNFFGNGAKFVADPVGRVRFSLCGLLLTGWSCTVGKWKKESLFQKIETSGERVCSSLKWRLLY